MTGYRWALIAAIICGTVGHSPEGALLLFLVGCSWGLTDFANRKDKSK